MNLKNYIFILIPIFFISCGNKEKEEDIVINSFLNQYLENEYLGKVLDFDTLQNYPNIKNNILDTSNIKVHLSRSQLPIKILKEDNYWLFSTKYCGENRKIFNKIISEQNLENDFRIIDTSKII